MKSHYLKDLKKRFFFKKIEILKLVCLYLTCAPLLLNEERYKIYLNFFFSKKLNINFILTNHCILTKNSKAINRFSSLTRSNLKHLISYGYLNGIRKWDW